MMITYVIIIVNIFKQAMRETHNIRRCFILTRALILYQWNTLIYFDLLSLLHILVDCIW